MKMRIDLDKMAIEKKLKMISQKVKSRKVPLNRAATILMTSTTKRFTHQVDPEGQPWQQLSRRTIDTRRKGKKKKFSPQILQDTGTLKKSLAGGTEASINTVTDSELIFGTALHYAIKHQQGIGVPVRKILGITPEDQRNIIQVFSDWLNKILKEKA
jgi:phage virion morphogenesis protein